MNCLRVGLLSLLLCVSGPALAVIETYEFSDPALEEKDPYNQLLARQIGIRLPAELVREHARWALQRQLSTR